MEELSRRHRRRVLVLEEDAETARELQERNVPVVRLRRALEEMDFTPIGHAAAIVANGSDHFNAALLMIARENGFAGPFFALMDDPLHRQPLTAWGARPPSTRRRTSWQPPSRRAPAGASARRCREFNSSENT
jgi:hypothetical protein